MTQPQAALAQRLSFGRMASRSIVANVGSGLLGGLVALCGLPSKGLIVYLTAQSVLVFATTAIGTGVLVRPRLWPDCIADMRREAFAASIVRRSRRREQLPRPDRRRRDDRQRAAGVLQSR